MYPDRRLYLEEAMEITKRLEKEELADFTASNEWLKKLKEIYGMREKRLWRSQGGFHNKSASLVLPITRVVPSLTYFATQDYEPRNILNLDELGLFFKVLLENKLMEKGKKVARNLNNVWLL